MKERKKGRGIPQLAKYRAGASLSPTQSILAKCAECCGDYLDGAEDCKIPRCPLYPFMPYGKGERKKRPVSEEVSAKLSARAKARFGRPLE